MESVRHRTDTGIVAPPDRPANDSRAPPPARRGAVPTVTGLMDPIRDPGPMPDAGRAPPRAA